MKSIIQSTAVAVLATASLAAQADTFSLTNEFNDALSLTTGGFSHSGVKIGFDKDTKDFYAELDNANDVLTYSFSLLSASDVTISFWYGSDKSGGKDSKEDATSTVSWMNTLGPTSVSLNGGSSPLSLVAPDIDSTAPSPAGSFASYAVTGLNAGNYTFTIDPSTGNNFRVDTFAVNSVTAVPEPETYAMMLAGLGALGFMARRRKQG